jgi:hypothetical protein
VAAGDPRPSVQERYHSYTQYRRQVIEAVDKLVRRRLMICHDTKDIVTRLLQAGLTAGVPAPLPDEDASAPAPVRACVGHMPPRYRYHQVYDREDGRD